MIAVSFQSRSLFFCIASLVTVALSCLQTANVDDDLPISQISNEWTVVYCSKRDEASKVGTMKIKYKKCLSHLRKKQTTDPLKYGYLK